MVRTIGRREKAGYGEWGRAMQDDVTAGAEWLVKEHIADPRRMCIVGASYGGYAAAHTPKLFRCGVSLAGVTDLAYMMKDASDINERPEGRLFRRANVGNRDLLEEQFAAVSPVRDAARFEGPVLIAHGDVDRRVPIEHSRRLVDALKRNGRAVEWLELTGSGHDFVIPANQERFYEALFGFLERNTKVEAK